MATSQHTTTDTIRLPITGRCGDRSVVRGWATVSHDDFSRDVLCSLFWNINNMGYAYRRAPRPNRSVILLHRFVFEHYHGPVPADKEVDHIDRDPLNNTPANLRAVTHSDNLSNIGKRRDNTSGFKGVFLVNKGMPKPWHACITVRGRSLSLKYFATPAEAARAVDAAYREHLPNIQPPNFPSEA